MLWEILGWLFGIRDVESIDAAGLSLAAPWAASDPTWLIAGCAAAVALSVWYYTRVQTGLGRGKAALLATVRALVLVLLVVTLADPIVRLTARRLLQPVLYVVLDGTQSMSLRDNLTADELHTLSEAVGLQATSSDSAPPALTRQEWVKAYLQRPEDNWLAQLSQRDDLEVEYFLFDGQSTSVPRRLVTGDGLPSSIAAELTASGQVTALGEMLHDLGIQTSRRLGGVVLISDFAHNSGAAPLGTNEPGQPTPLERLGVPVFTIGVGAVSSRDVQVEVQPPPKMKKAERATITVRVGQSGVLGESALVTVTARPLDGTASHGEGDSLQEIEVGSQEIVFDSSLAYLEFPFIPQQSGRFSITAQAQVLPGEVSDENNHSSRTVNIIDDYIRLTYIENEPTWEWRFVKEVFHRDRLVGLEGFRTFLRSADPQVRQSNRMFLPTLTPQRSEFFANDVLFLGDMPGEALNERFCRMVKQFVGQFGGGLVVIAGPHHGPSQLLGTEIADMLPVKLDRALSLRANHPFTLQITPLGRQSELMQLGESPAEDRLAPWSNLGKLPWYQPVVGLHPQAVVLAEHPIDLCADGQTPQPLVATRRYGSGEVVYIGFNELWRLRRMHGERYYRQFWSQIISRLALSHALGSQKRFVLSIDQPQYEVDDRALLAVEAYDENFDPLPADRLPTEGLQAELLLEDAPSSQPVVVTLSESRPGRFETQVPLYEAGRYTVRVTDPVTAEDNELQFDVLGTSVEQRNPARNLALQEGIAQATGGVSYELHDAHQITSQLRLEPVAEDISRSFPLWASPLWFLLVVILLLSEWLIRKRANLA